MKTHRIALYPGDGIGVDVTDNGGVQRWKLELDNRWELENVGMHAETFKPGDLIVASGSAGRDGARALYVRQLDRRSDGLRYEQVGASPRLGGRGQARGMPLAAPASPSVRWRPAAALPAFRCAGRVLACAR